MKLRLLLLMIIAFVTMYIVAQTDDDERVHLVHADELFYKKQLNPNAQILVGNVQFLHKGVVLTCDSALFYQANNSFDAFGNVYMNQGDTLTLTSDVLFYDGFTEIARSRYNVVLTHINTVLYCDSLDYDRLYDLGYFFNGGRMVDQDNTLTSEWGQYSPTTKQAVFNYDVVLENPEFTLTSDTLEYNTETDVADIVGPSNIYNGDNHIYSENGTYDTKAHKAYLLDRSVVSNNGKIIVGDSLYYQEEGKLSKAYYNVIMRDTVNKNILLGNYVLYSDSTGYSEATDSAVCIDYSQRDSMFIHADTFKLFTYNIDTDTLWREMRAYNRVRAYRIDIQAVCDSMVYISKDSCLTMYEDPILWQQGQQLLGEEIKAWLNDSTIDSTHVERQALSVERLDSVSYNQVTGNIMRSFFEEGRMKLTWVQGNVIINYFPLDDDSLMIGMLHCLSSQLKLYMGEQKIDKIWMPESEGTLHPLALIPPSERYLENFQWFDYIRPLNKDDIFIWRPKKAGTELKKAVEHKAPAKPQLPPEKKKKVPKRTKDEGLGTKDSNP